MCGIAGFAGMKNGLTPSQLMAMRDTLTHRGPDDAGLQVWRGDGQLAAPDEAGTQGLAHRRLSIIDLSAAGHQPMSNEDGTVWIAYNGEFYNFADYRAELAAHGHRFASKTDTEIILHLYEEYGIEGTLQRINGMFAFAIWDAPRQRLILARDRFGKKPLYYAPQAGGGILFASEQKALWATGRVSRTDLDEVGFDQTLSFGASLVDRTMHRDIRQVPAAHFAVWEDGRLDVRKYWSLPLCSEPVRERSLDDAADELEALLEDAIRIRLTADVPVGLFLSGGIDSSLVAAVTARKVKRSFMAYTVGFTAKEYDESAHARAVADQLGLPIEVSIEGGDSFDSFEKIAAAFDQPFGDNSAYSTYVVSRAARRGVTVALTGDGGDELFGGYYAYSVSQYLWGTASWKMNLPAAWVLRQRLRGFRSGFLNLHAVFGIRYKLALYRSPLHALRVHRASERSRLEQFEEVATRPHLDQMQYSDERMLADSILQKVDRMSMLTSLECRSPLLDHRIATFAASLPLSLRMDATGRGKILLRHLLARYLPEAMINRPKQGFCTPWEHWCSGDFAETLRQRWQASPPAFMKPTAADIAFPRDGSGSPYRMWCAFTHVVHAELARKG